MKPDLILASNPVDRLATPDEVQAAVMPFPDPIERCGTDILREIASDFAGYVRIPALDLEASLLVEELNRGDGSTPN